MSEILPLDNSVFQDYNANVNFTSTTLNNVDSEGLVFFTIPSSSSLMEEVYVENTVNDYPFVVENVPYGQSTSICSITISSSGCFMQGLTICGDTDGDFSVYVNSIRIHRFITNVNNPNIIFQMPYRRNLNVGDNLTILCENTGLNSAEYNATISGYLS